MAQKVLVAHEERHITRLLEVNLQRAGYEVLIAHDAREVIQSAQSEHPDLIIVDWMMTSVPSTLKDDPGTCDIPVQIIGPDGRLIRP